MKKITYLLLLPVLASFFSCEEVVDVETGSMAPRLVVDASIKWYKGSRGNIQMIYLSETTNYYQDSIPPAVSNARISVSNEFGTEFFFIENESNKGLYLCDNFFPEIGERYTLSIRTEDGELYTASETLYPSPELTHTTQEQSGLLERNRLVKAFFTDPPQQGNFYMHQYAKLSKRPQTSVIDDKHTNGNEMFTARFFDELDSGEVINIELMGISERYFNYMNKIYANTSEANIGPFRTPPAQVRGNIINLTNQNKYAMGYFRLCEVSGIVHIAE